MEAASQASTKIMTVMFVDIVGFSIIAQRHSPAECFRHLTSLLTTLADIVQQEGGRVAKTLGDGALCYFEDRPGDEASGARNAILCAARIQRHFRAQDVQSVGTGRPIYPLRIGINTAEILIGEFGLNERTEVAVIGHGINFAQRLEVACDPYSIMVGAMTAEKVGDLQSHQLKPRKRLVKVKHQTDLIEAYEYSPFDHSPLLIEEAIKAYRDFIGAERTDTRWSVDTGKVRVVTDAGEGNLVDYSVHGLGVELPVYLAHGVHVSMRIAFDDQGETDYLSLFGLETFVGEVRWARPLNDRFLHGILLKFQQPGQGKVLSEAIRQRLIFSKSA